MLKLVRLVEIHDLPRQGQSIRKINRNLGMSQQ